MNKKIIINKKVKKEKNKNICHFNKLIKINIKLESFNL